MQISAYYVTVKAYTYKRWCFNLNFFYCISESIQQIEKVKVKWSHYRPGVAQRVDRGIAVLFHDNGTRRGWVVSSKPRPHFTPRKDPVPILQEAGWAPGPVWIGGRSRPHRDSIPDRPAHSSVAILTELRGPPIQQIYLVILEVCI